MTGTPPNPDGAKPTIGPNVRHATRMTRRSTLMGLSAAALSGAGARAAEDRWMLPEWERHAGCAMTWSAAHGLYYASEIARIHREQAAIARAIATFEPVVMLANADDLTEAARLCGPTVRIVELTHFDIWARDTMPTFGLDSAGNVTATGWNFNVWGEKYPGYDDDRTLARRFAGIGAASFLPPPREQLMAGRTRYIQAPIVAEGGALEADGVGAVMTAETCLLNPNRNPGLSRAEIEAALKRYCPARQVIWLWGSEADTITDGHVDGFARFIRPDLAIVEVTDDTYDPEYHDLRENAARLEVARNGRGDRIEVIRLLRPRWNRLRNPGEDFAASYVNSYFPNGGIVMPSFGDAERDEAARELFAALDPGRRIVQLDIDEIARGGGGIHCCTMQIPAR